MFSFANKKILFGVIVLILAGGGIFYWWWQNQADVRALNKTLPEGVRVTKSWFGSEYKVVNRIEGYQFGVPGWWKGVSEVDYLPEEVTNGGKGIFVQSTNQDMFGLVKHDLQLNLNLENLVDALNKSTDGGYEKLGEERLGMFRVIKTTDRGFTTPLYYFFESTKAIYEIRTLYEDDVPEIIKRGNW